MPLLYAYGQQTMTVRGIMTQMTCAETDKLQATQRGKSAPARSD